MTLSDHCRGQRDSPFWDTGLSEGRATFNLDRFSLSCCVAIEPSIYPLQAEVKYLQSFNEKRSQLSDYRDTKGQGKG